MSGGLIDVATSYRQDLCVSVAGLLRVQPRSEQNRAQWL